MFQSLSIQFALCRLAIALFTMCKMTPSLISAWSEKPPRGAAECFIIGWHVCQSLQAHFTQNYYVIDILTSIYYLQYTLTCILFTVYPDIVSLRNTTRKGMATLFFSSYNGLGTYIMMQVYTMYTESA